MNHYRIQHRIKAMSWLDVPFTFEGFTFENWIPMTTEGHAGNAWIAERTVDAEDLETAVNQFRSALGGIIGKMAFVGQIYLNFNTESFFVCRVNDNAENHIFISYAKESSGSPLCFGIEEKSSLEALVSYEYNQAFTYFMESNNSVTYTGRLSMLIKGLEAIAGTMEKTSRCDGCQMERKRSAVNEDKIKEILNDNAFYLKIFGRGGIRHRLSHGAPLEETTDDDASPIYDAVIRYFNGRIGTKIATEVVRPQRGFYGNYLVTEGIYEIVDGDMRGLRELTGMVAQPSVLLKRINRSSY